MALTRTAAMVDRVADRLTRIGYHLPQCKKEIQGLLKRLDRVANQLDLSVRHASMAAVESDLDQAGIQYSVGPAANSQGHSYFIPKSQDNPRKLQSSLQQIATKHGAHIMESGNGSNYRLDINSSR